jgi:hypothetical protein
MHIGIFSVVNNAHKANNQIKRDLGRLFEHYESNHAQCSILEGPTHVGTHSGHQVRGTLV